MATLVTTSDQPCIVVPDNLDGVRIAGLLLEAKSETVSSLLLWGISGGGNTSNPGVMSDVFARNGVFTTETVSSSIDTMVRVASVSVIIDNTWVRNFLHKLCFVIIFVHHILFNTALESRSRHERSCNDERQSCQSWSVRSITLFCLRNMTLKPLTTSP